MFVEAEFILTSEEFVQMTEAKFEVSNNHFLWFQGRSNYLILIPLICSSAHSNSSKSDTPTYILKNNFFLNTLLLIIIAFLYI